MFASKAPLSPCQGDKSCSSHRLNTCGGAVKRPVPDESPSPISAGERSKRDPLSEGSSRSKTYAIVDTGRSGFIKTLSGSDRRQADERVGNPCIHRRNR